MAIPVLYWMLECTACGSRRVVHDCYLVFVGSSDPNPAPGEGYEGPPLPARYTCTKGCRRPMKAIASITHPSDEEMWLHQPHVRVRMTKEQADEWRRLLRWQVLTGVAFGPWHAATRCWRTFVVWTRKQ
jgi:hypothetical protein